MDASALMARLGDSLTAGRVFGEPIERDGCTVIPVAFLAGGAGGGTEAAREAVGDRPARGPGEGTGAGMVCWPIGAYVIKNGDARFVPSFDVAQLIVLGSYAVTRVMRMRQRRLALRHQRKLARG
jgi:uncharacterized spore protein YtfJ